MKQWRDLHFLIVGRGPWSDSTVVRLAVLNQPLILTTNLKLKKLKNKTVHTLYNCPNEQHDFHKAAMFNFFNDWPRLCLKS